MNFPNAQAGIKKIFTAEILKLIATVCSAFAVAFGYLMTKTVDVEGNVATEGGLLASFGGFAILGLAALVLMIIAFIFNLIGVTKASKDEPAFKIVLYLILAGIAVSIISGFIPNETVKSIFQVISDVLGLAVTIFIIQGIRNLAVKVGNTAVDNKGMSIYKIIIAIYVLIIIARIVSLIAATAAAVVAGVFAIVSAILYIVVYIIYLSFLKQAKDMF